VSIHMKQNGFALTELIIVIVILTTLVSIATLSYNNMQRKANTERYTREFFADLNTARSDSIFRKNRHSIVINGAANGYAFRRYSSENESRTTGGQSNPLVGQPPQYGIVFTKTIPLVLSKEDGTSAAGDIFQFDTRGFAAGAQLATPEDIGIIRINPVGTGAIVDCVVITESRTNLGRMEGANCVQK